MISRFRAFRQSALLPLVFLVAGCGTEAHLPMDFCQAIGRSLSPDERKVSALAFARGASSSRKILWGKELEQVMPAGNPDISARTFLKRNPSCCSVDEPWAVKDGRFRSELTETIYEATNRKFNWLYDVNIVFTDNRGYSRHIDLATDPCGNFYMTNHG